MRHITTPHDGYPTRSCMCTPLALLDLGVALLRRGRTRSLRLSTTTLLVLAVAVTLTATACALSALTRSAYAAMGPTTKSARTPRMPCQREPGHTILRRGVVRVFRHSGNVYGCVNGSTRRIWLWEILPETRGSVTQVAGRFVAFDWLRDDQYEYDHYVIVVDLRTASAYSVAELTQPLTELPEGNPPTPGPWPLDGYTLGTDGRTARLYDSYVGTMFNQILVGQVLDLVGFHGYDRQLATGGPGAIIPKSLAYHDHTVTWTQDGSPRAMSV